MRIRRPYNRVGPGGLTLPEPVPRGAVMAKLSYQCGSMGEAALTLQACEVEAQVRSISSELWRKYGTTRVYC